MGWPLAVSAGLIQGSRRAMPKALLLMTTGHFVAMTAILLPFSLMATLFVWESQIRLGAGLLVIGTGILLLIYRRHPRFLSRVHPAKLALWSFLAAMAHGAGLVLLPIYLEICSSVDLDAGHRAAGQLMGGKAVETALAVAAVHTVAMAVAGSVMALIIYFWLGLRFLSKAWFNLDLFWACSLIVVGGFGIYTAI